MSEEKPIETRAADTDGRFLRLFVQHEQALRAYARGHGAELGCGRRSDPGSQRGHVAGTRPAHRTDRPQREQPLRAQLAQAQFTDPGGDIDGDGLASLLEFAFGTDPSKPQAGSPVTLSTVTLPGEGDYPALTFRRRTGTGAPTYLVEASENLTTWTANTEGQPPVTVEVGSPVVHGDGFETVTVRHVLPVSAAAKRYLRVKVIQP